MPSPEGFSPASPRFDTANTSDLWTPEVWKNIAIDNLRSGKQNGVLIEKYFNLGFKPSTNLNAAEAYWEDGWMAFGSDGATLTFNSEAGFTGGVQLASDGDNEGAAIRTQASPFKFGRANKRFACEWVVEVSTITDTKHGRFFGLMDATAATVAIPIADAAALADVNLVGFHGLESDGDKLDLVYKANGVTAVTVGADAITLVAGTEARLGITYDGYELSDFDRSQKYILRWWANGRIITSVTGYKQIPSTDGDDFPNDVAMGLVAAIRNATASTPGNSEVKRVRAAQYF
jgi:hypothetical protein